MTQMVIGRTRVQSRVSGSRMHIQFFLPPCFHPQGCWHYSAERTCGLACTTTLCDLLVDSPVFYMRFFFHAESPPSCPVIVNLSKNVIRSLRNIKERPCLHLLLSAFPVISPSCESMGLCEDLYPTSSGPDNFRMWPIWFFPLYYSHKKMLSK